MGHLVVFVIFMMCKCVLSPVSSDKLEGISVMYLVVDKLFVEIFNGFVLVS